MKFESDSLEFKKQISDSIIKEIIAFCNSNGGTIIIGYDDEGKIVGLENAKRDLDVINNSIYDSISPDVSFLTSLNIVKEDEKDIIIIKVLKGIHKPYYIKSKGMTPDGVYIRVGATSQKATDDIIRDMIIESYGVTFEKNISLNQDLTFTYADMVFKNKNIAFGDIEKKNLGLINENNLYTNLGLLLSDQCPYTIKMAVYPDNTKTSFLDTKETNIGSILKQIEEANDYLKLNNKIKSEIVGLQRIDTPEYNSEVLRESLLNSVSHKDYSINGSVLIHIFKDYIEFINSGGLVSGLTIDDIKLGHSSSRNPGLVNIFHRLNLVEAYGTGIPRIMEVYIGCEEKPEITVAPHSFLLKIPKINNDNKEETIIIDYIKDYGSINRTTIQEILNVKKNHAVELVNKMIEKNILTRKGNARGSIYTLK